MVEVAEVRIKFHYETEGTGSSFCGIPVMCYSEIICSPATPAKSSGLFVTTGTP